MKWAALLFTLFTTYKVSALNFYFSSVTGNDQRTVAEAHNAATPWKTLSKLNSIFSLLNPGDSVLFRKGDTFEGSIKVVKSGLSNKPIVFAAYGVGNAPVISGFTTLSRWANMGNGIFETATPLSLSTIKMLVINDMPEAIGRYPNAGAVNKGYLNFEGSVKNTQITDNQLSANPNWTNAEVVIRKNRWVIDRNYITSHSGKTINYVSASRYSADVNSGYFIQNHPKTLDLDGEWYFNRTVNKLGILFKTGLSSSKVIKISTRDTLVSLANQQNIVFYGISFRGSNKNAFEITNCNRVKVINCEIFFSGVNAINASKNSALDIEYSFIYYSNNIALNINSCSGTIIKNNKIKCTGVFEGMGEGDSGSYEALMISGDNNLIELNEIDSTGYIPITFNGNNVTVQNNYINHFAFVKDDGGGIYTYNGSGTPLVNYARKISGNIIVNGLGAGAGTADTASRHASGIYMDDKVNNVDILNNTVANCGLYGIFIHNTNNVTIKENVLFNNGRQIGLVHDKIAPDNPVKTIALQNNILFSKNVDAVVAEYKTVNNDLKYFGSFDSNYYCRPFNDNLVFNIAYVENGTSFNYSKDLAGWIAMYGKDKNSKKTPVTMPAYKLDRLNGANKFINGSFNNNISGLYTWSAAGNSVISWNNSNALDKGSLQISFSKLTGPANHASVIIGVGDVIANKTYILRFSLKGADEHKPLQMYLRKSLSDYSDLSARKNVLINASRTENEVMFTARSTQAKASIVFDIMEQSSPLYLDNIQLYDAEVSVVDPDKAVRFEYNPGTTIKKVAIEGTYTDLNGKVYINQVDIAPHRAGILLKQQGSFQTSDRPSPPVYTSISPLNYRAGEGEQTIITEKTIAITGKRQLR